MGTLAIIGTPIGNLSDISARALEALRAADAIFAEDTRVTAKLLARYEIAKRAIRADEEVSDRVLPLIIERLEKGENLAFVTDAGTPGVSDPGWRIVRGVRSALPRATITPIPGPSAVAAALSVSGMNAGSFTFLGYPPHQKGRRTFFDAVISSPVRPVVFYESPHRMEKALKELAERDPERLVIVLRELTKLHEEIVSGTPQEVLTKLGANVARGEFVIIVA